MTTKILGFFENSAFTNKFLWEALPSDSWHGRPCYIVGGGPSLEKHWAWLVPKLHGQLTIGINCAYEKFDPTIIFGMDPTFVRHILMGKYGEPALKAWNQSKALKAWLCTYVCKMPDDVYILKCIGGYSRARRAFPPVMEEGIGHGNNSGYGALNLAACLGANPIYLLGYDMHRGEDGKSNWHESHPKQMPDNVPARFKKDFTIAHKELDKRGIKVVNLNPKSALDCFPKADLMEGFPTPQPLIRTEHIKRIQPTREEAKYGPILKEPAVPEPAPKKKLPDLFIIGPYGFGDTFYLRSLVRSLAKKHLNIYVRTTLPEAFWDIENVRFVRPTLNKLRAQKEHVEHIDKSDDYKWEKPPSGIERKTWHQLLPSWERRPNEQEINATTNNLRGEENSTKYFENEFGLKDFDFSFPVKKEWTNEAKKIITSLNMKGKKLCIIRPSTVRKDWACYTRNPKPEYFQAIIDKYKDEYFFISVANNKQGQEWSIDKLSGIDKRYDNGELFITTLFGMIKLADMVLTPPDLFSVMAISMRTKCFCIFGGCAKPQVIFDENMGFENFEYVAPEPFCNCMRMEHECNKEIPKKLILQRFEELSAREKYLKKVSVAIPPGTGDMHWVLTILESFKIKNSIDKLEIVNIDRGPVHMYSSHFLNLIPFVDSVKLMRHVPFDFTINGGNGTPLRQNVDGIDYLIEFNSKLEHGVRIEDILPEYSVDFDYAIREPRPAKNFAKLIKKGAGNKLYLLYASSKLSNRHWCKGTWEQKEWVALADKIYAETKRKAILIGADWDKDYAQELKKQDVHDNIYDMVGKTNISEMLALLREANFVVSFLCGVTILAAKLKVPCVSFWPTLKLAPHWHDPKKFQTSWIRPDENNGGYYMPLFYGEKGTDVDGVFDKIERYL